MTDPLIAAGAAVSPSLTPSLPSARSAAPVPSPAPSSAASAAPDGAPPPRGGTGSSAALSSDFETFLRMLTAQVQNQDPLNPLESTDFAVQLATFSNVEQQVQTNTLLTQLTDAMAMEGGLAEMAGYVGRQALVASAPRFDGTPIALEVTTMPETSRAELRVYDGLGRLVDARQIDPAGGPVTWDGRTGAGPAARGRYAFEVVSEDAAGQVLGTATPRSFVDIAEVRRGETGLEVKLVNGDTVAEAEVVALRDG